MGVKPADSAFTEALTHLSHREHEVLLLICAGAPPAKIAARMRISVKTVQTYRARIMEKLDIHSNVLLALACERAGLLE